MYMMIFEDNRIALTAFASTDDLQAADDGYMTIIDISVANEPTQYADGEWLPIEILGL